MRLSWWLVWRRAQWVVAENGQRKLRFSIFLAKRMVHGVGAASSQSSSRACSAWRARIKSLMWSAQNRFCQNRQCARNKGAPAKVRKSENPQINWICDGIIIPCIGKCGIKRKVRATITVGHKELHRRREGRIEKSRNWWKEAENALKLPINESRSPVPKLKLNYVPGMLGRDLQCDNAQGYGGVLCARRVICMRIDNRPTQRTLLLLFAFRRSADRIEQENRHSCRIWLQLSPMECSHYNWLEFIICSTNGGCCCSAENWVCKIGTNRPRVSVRSLNKRHLPKATKKETNTV